MRKTEIKLCPSKAAKGGQKNQLLSLSKPSQSLISDTA
jgi:hypothetical protein